MLTLRKMSNKDKSEGSSKLMRFLRFSSKDKDHKSIITTPTSDHDFEVPLENISRQDLACTDKLGEGSFGAVYKGTWTLEDGTKRVVAIKQMNCGVTSDISYDDVLKEAQIQYTLNHPNVVNLFGVSYARGQQELWLIMKLVKGQDLASFIFPERGSKIELPAKLNAKICLRRRRLHS